MRMQRKISDTWGFDDKAKIYGTVFGIRTGEKRNNDGDSDIQQDWQERSRARYDAMCTGIILYEQYGNLKLGWMEESGVWWDECFRGVDWRMMFEDKQMKERWTSGKIR